MVGKKLQTLASGNGYFKDKLKLENLNSLDMHQIFKVE